MFGANEPLDNTGFGETAGFDFEMDAGDEPGDELATGDDPTVVIDGGTGPAHSYIDAAKADEITGGMGLSEEGQPVTPIRPGAGEDPTDVSGTTAEEQLNGLDLTAARGKGVGFSLVSMLSRGEPSSHDLIAKAIANATAAEDAADFAASYEVTLSRWVEEAVKAARARLAADAGGRSKKSLSPAELQAYAERLRSLVSAPGRDDGATPDGGNPAPGTRTEIFDQNTEEGVGGSETTRASYGQTSSAGTNEGGGQHISRNTSFEQAPPESSPNEPTEAAPSEVLTGDVQRPVGGGQYLDVNAGRTQPEGLNELRLRLVNAEAMARHGIDYAAMSEAERRALDTELGGHDPETLDPDLDFHRRVDIIEQFLRNRPEDQ